MITQEQIQAVAHQIAQKFNPLKVLLFGSYGRNEAHPRSDVDLLVILEDDQRVDDPEVEVATSVTHSFPMDILVRSPQQVAERLRMGDSFYRDIVEKGVVLYERPGG
ncbi:nucleotidyltransferase domain-containing protein [candidate division KSB1 bacterium]|nr:MAG: nucleotidyltransferase domain-containing protein [candidate division KSB1 bacterium]MBC6951073.1 nucleotidyltransferase domain-containing protein [candidate division KSB1 bacterium]MCE7943701.1 nucleotidyltransferase domain-containing protein [Chlorobi bacterium CHB1]MDL1877857.1 nucleotidyltransferase domain-containing protein [Cytophagia bacterium CHB2]